MNKRILSVRCGTCGDVTEALVSQVGDMLTHHADLHDVDAPVDFVVTVRDDDE